jgi:hypothetical protein
MKSYEIKRQYKKGIIYKELNLDFSGFDSKIQKLKGII